ncbi:hypothetical protein GJAV_G00053800, partial [Gymnothorax javanicus]
MPQLFGHIIRRRDLGIFKGRGTNPKLEMPKRRDILAIVLIVLPWTLLITVWHQSAIAPLLAIRK